MRYSTSCLSILSLVGALLAGCADDAVSEHLVCSPVAGECDGDPRVGHVADLLSSEIDLYAFETLSVEQVDTLDGFSTDEASIDGETVMTSAAKYWYCNSDNYGEACCTWSTGFVDISCWYKSH